MTGTDSESGSGQMGITAPFDEIKSILENSSDEDIKKYKEQAAQKIYDLFPREGDSDEHEGNNILE